MATIEDEKIVSLSSQAGVHGGEFFDGRERDLVDLRLLHGGRLLFHVGLLVRLRLELEQELPLLPLLLLRPSSLALCRRQLKFVSS